MEKKLQSNTPKQIETKKQQLPKGENSTSQQVMPYPLLKQTQPPPTQSTNRS